MQRSSVERSANGTDPFHALFVLVLPSRELLLLLPDGTHLNQMLAGLSYSGFAAPPAHIISVLHSPVQTAVRIGRTAVVQSSLAICTDCG